MPQLGRFKCSIECERIPLREYAVEVSGNEVSCYIASEERKPFKIVCQELERHADVSCSTSAKIDIDGECITFQFLNGTIRRTVVREYQHVIDPFTANCHALVFSRLETTDDDDFALTSVSEDVGTIVVGMCEFVKTGDISMSRPNERVLSPALVHERSKKAGTHSVSLSQEPTRVIMPTPGIAVRWLDPRKPWPIVVFRFNYRPRALLQASGLIRNVPRFMPVVENRQEDLPRPIKAGGSAANVRCKIEEPEVIVLSDDDEADSKSKRVARITMRKARRKATKPFGRRAPIKVEKAEIIDLTGM